jgi:hypothetical protein
MQKYFVNFLQPEKEVKPPWPGWKPQPDPSRLITIGPSHFFDGFEKTIEEIQFGEFQCCYNLVSLDLSSLCNLKKIGDFTFQNAWALREISFPPSLECISCGSFENCTNLEQLDLSGLCNLTDMVGELFKNAWSLREITFPPRVKKINNRSFMNCTSLTRLDFSNCELEVIGFDAFTNAWSLREIIFPASLKESSAGSFWRCTSLTRLDLSHCVQFEEFGNNFFTDAFSLREVIFPPNLPKIKITNHSFRNCTSLTRLRIPASVNEIETDAFSGCTNLEEVVFENPAQIEIHDRAFQNCPRLARIPRRPKRHPGFLYGKYSDLKGSLQFGQGSEDGTCGISLEEFRDESNIVVLPCGHAYIEEEFHEWFLRRNICPNCNVRLQ